MAAKRVVAKKGEYVVMQRPLQRRKKGMVDPDAGQLRPSGSTPCTRPCWCTRRTALARAMSSCKTGLKRDTTFKACLQALINAIPAPAIKGKFARPEAGILDRIRLAFYADEITAPPEEEPTLPVAKQSGLFEQVDENAFADDEGEEEDE